VSEAELVDRVLEQEQIKEHERGQIDRMRARFASELQP
jgi:hypothetical protein